VRDKGLLGSWVRRFLLEHLIGERNLARNTQRSYRDTLRLLLPFAAHRARKAIDRLTVEDLTANRVLAFLEDLEKKRGCGAATRNQRLAAVHSLARFIATNSPEHVDWCGRIRSIPFKKAPPPLVTYLEKPEIEAVLASPDVRTVQGCKDYAVLLFLYNTGARADEVAHVLIGDLELGRVPKRDLSAVLIRGKGDKRRRCPLWARTVTELGPLIANRGPEEHVFLNRRGEPLTRFGVHALVERHARKATAKLPSLANKRVGPHTIRHTTATHLLRAGVDINTIRAWLGHASLATTNIYAEVDLEMKAKALESCEIKEERGRKAWRQNAGLMEFLRNL
jgi:integrase/recombinase XerD